MSRTVSNAPSSDPLRLPDTFGAPALKVGMESDGIGIGSVVFEALVQHFGTVKVLAFELGQADPSQVRAEIKAGDFRRLDKHAKPAVRAVVAEAVQSAYGKNYSVDDDAEQTVAMLFALATRLAQYVAFKRTA